MEEKVSFSNDFCELLTDFCKQYTVNNDKLGNFLIAIVSSLIVVFTGYALAITKFDEHLILATTISLFVICLLSSLSMSFGYCRRRDQNVAYQIITNISNRAEIDEDLAKMKAFFSDGQGKCWFCFVPDFYNHLFWFLQIVIALICGDSAYLLISCCCKMIAVIILGVSALIFNIIIRTYYYSRYNKLNIKDE